MPELPEVETIRRDLNKKILRKKIKDVQTAQTTVIKNPVDFFVSTLRGNEFVFLDRIGKLLIFHLKSGEYLLIHLKMTGKLVYGKKTKKKPHIHATLTFFDNSTLRFEDARKFGYLKLADAFELEKVKRKFGIEPLTAGFVLSKFEKIFTVRSASVKAVLLNQACIAGIGNIYADEICFAAGIHPGRSAKKLSTHEIKKLFFSCNEIIKNAIAKRGTTFYSYVDGAGRPGKYYSFLKVYHRAGKPCMVCATPIKKIRVAGRGTHFCSHCQK